MPPENRGDQIVMRGRTLAEVVVFESGFFEPQQWSGEQSKFNRVSAVSCCRSAGSVLESVRFLLCSYHL